MLKLSQLHLDTLVMWSSYVKLSAGADCSSTLAGKVLDGA